MLPVVFPRLFSRGFSFNCSWAGNPAGWFMTSLGASDGVALIPQTAAGWVSAARAPDPV